MLRHCSLLHHQLLLLLRSELLLLLLLLLRLRVVWRHALVGGHALVRMGRGHALIWGLRRHDLILLPVRVLSSRLVPRLLCRPIWRLTESWGVLILPTSRRWRALYGPKKKTKIT